MKRIKKVAVSPIPKINGSVVNTRNVEDKTTNALSIAQIDRENTYATVETFTGKYWIDGKKIYRKVYVVTDLIKNGSEQIVYIQPDVNEITAITGLQRSSSGFTAPVPTIWNNDLSGRNSMVWVDVSASGGYVKYKINSGWESTTKLTIILEYTKTTD